MESLAAFLVTAAIVAVWLKAGRAHVLFFVIALCLVLWLLHEHATDSLPLNF